MAAGRASAAGDPFEALGDPNRRAILRLLSEGDKAVQAIAAELPISRPAVSRHLRLLKDAGLVARHPADLPAAGRGPARGPGVPGGRLGGSRRAVPAAGRERDSSRPRPGRPRPAGGVMTEPLRMTFDVACPAEHAFTVWTSAIGTW